MRIAPRTFFGQPKVRTVGQRTTINRKSLLDPSRRGPEALQEHGAAASVINPSAHNASTAPSAMALVGFRGGGAGSRNQACDKGAEQGSPTPARVVDELEEAEIKRQLVLRETPVRAQPGAQQGPEPGSCRLSGWWGPD